MERAACCVQAFAPSWLPAIAYAYEEDAPGVGALVTALQEWIDGGHPPLSFVDDPQVCTRQDPSAVTTICQSINPMPNVHFSKHACMHR